MMNDVRCTLCDCAEVENIDSTIRNADNDKYKMYKCSCCETHFLYPRPDGSQLEEYYDGQFRSEVHSGAYYDKARMDGMYNWYTPEANVRVERVKNELSKDDVVLEIGCSVGYFMGAVAPYVKSVYGTEWDIKAGQYVKDRFPKFNIGVNPQDFGIKFDKIFMFHVLEHVEEPVEFLKGLKELLNPGGVIYVEVPNADDVLVKTYNCKAFMRHYYKLAHIYNFNYKGIEYILDNAKLDGEISYIQRYDLSNHMVWLGQGVPGGNKKYLEVLGEEANMAYVKALEASKQTVTLFIRIRRGTNE